MNKKLNSQHISIGKDLSINYDINIGDKILIMSPTGIETIVGSLPKQETYIVDSVFDSGISDFDQNIAFINIKDLENLFNLEQEINEAGKSIKTKSVLGDIRDRDIMEKLFSEYYWQKLRKRKEMKGNKDELFTDKDARTKYHICWCNLI